MKRDSKESIMRMKSAVLYHYPCPDGAFAALAAHLYFSAVDAPALFFPHAVYNPLTPEQLPLQELSQVFLLDYIGSSGFVHQIASSVPVVLLDHHKTALEFVSANPNSNLTPVIDMERSGATIAFDYFREKLSIHHQHHHSLSLFDRLRPLYEYIQDADLWRWRLPDSKAFTSGLKDLNIEFSSKLNASLFQQLLSLDLEPVIRLGMSSLSFKQKKIYDTLEQSYKIALGGGAFGHCLAVNADLVSEFRSELGHQLAVKSHTLKLRGIGAVVYRVPEVENDRLLKISLRSIGGEDTTPIAQEFGGGGHENASSFMLSSSEFERWKVAEGASL